MIDKYERKMRDREINRDKHKDSIRHTFEPVSIDVLIQGRDALLSKLSHSAKYDVCIQILKSYKVRGNYDEYMLDDLERAVMMVVDRTRKDTRSIKNAVNLARDRASHRFSPNRMRRHYHRLAAREKGYGLGNSEHDEYEYILSTWHAVYGRRWNGEHYHIDHLKPLYAARSVGDVWQLNRLGNLCMLSSHCNQSKRHMFPHPIYYLIMELLC
jgi:hypothetical protein